MNKWYIRVLADGKAVLTITGTGGDVKYPSRLNITTAEDWPDLLAEIRQELIYPSFDMVWTVHSENDMYGWHAAIGAVISRKKETVWTVEHNLP